MAAISRVFEGGREGNVTDMTAVTMVLLRIQKVVGWVPLFVHQLLYAACRGVSCVKVLSN